MATKPPPPPPPAPTVKKKATPTSERGTFNNFINAHAALKPYAGQIWTYANQYGGITATQLAAVILFESGGDPNAKSPVGALGLAQIFDNTADPTNAVGVAFFRSNRNITAADKLNPAFAIQYIAWRMSGAVQRYGSVDQGYLQNYNPGYKGSATPISSLLPKGYVGVPSQTIPQSVTKSGQTAALKKTLTDPYVVLSHGTFKYVNSPTPPKGTITDAAGNPITRSLFVQDWQNYYSDTYAAYTGKHASPAEIARILKSGVSIYSLSNQLAKQPTFQGSPVYKQHAPGLQGIANQILGKGTPIPKGLLATAIAQNWDQATFEQHLRTLPAYRQGPEFQTNLAQNTAAFSQIYGNPDPAVKQDLENKTAAGWTPTELQSWLRSQDSYKTTPEYQAKMQAFMGPQGLGLITGQQATLTEAQTDAMLNSQASLKAGTGPNSTSSVQFPNQSSGAQKRAGIGVGGAGG